MWHLSPRALTQQRPLQLQDESSDKLPAPYGASQLGETPELGLMVGLILFTINIVFPEYISRKMLGNKKNCIKSITSFFLKAEKKALTS